MTNDRAHDLIVAAVMDNSGDGLKVLLSPLGTPGQRKVAVRRPNACLAGPAAEMLREDDDARRVDAL